MPQETISYLPLIAVLVPLFSFVMITCAKQVAWWRNSWSLIGSAGTLVAVVMMYPDISKGITLVLDLEMIVTPLGLTFRVDGLGFLIALLASFIWLMATVFALEYMNHEHDQGRFFIFFMLTLAGTVGVPLAGDLLTLLLFFELMSLASYVLVIHTQTREAFSAGHIYLYLGIFGGMCLLTGIGLIYFNTGTLSITQLPGLVEGINNYLLLAGLLLIIGFGIKAGMVPLHIWLPLAHPVAPAPASALLSGIMIKTGAYGIIRTLTMLYTPDANLLSMENLAAGVESLWSVVSDAGFVIIWLGIITMFFGACIALLQNNIKKMLACSSISQIGYIIMGIGVAAYLGYEGAMGLGGSAYHIINHAFFKSTLFLAAGAIVYMTGELDMNKLGGLRYRMPFTSVVVLIASLGIVGMPLFNGYASKTLLHHAIVEAYEHHHVYSLFIAEKIFTLTSAGTVCYFLKFLYFTFWRPAPDSLPEVSKEPLLMKVGMGTLAASMLFIGFSPNLILNKLVVPSLSTFTLDSYLVSYLAKSNFWKFEDLGAVAIALVLGAGFFYIAQKTNVYRLRVPYWLGLEFLGSLVGKLAIIFWIIITLPFVAIQNILNRLFEILYRRIFTFLQSVDYRPGQKAIFRSINISNIDFDMMLVIVSFSVILIVVFYLRFGLKIFNL
ncbi:MAG: proton-conducting transporter membrane subunit [Bacillota bacterium]|nr:proton-conducting transporter membrane subunit [Bacillota bacterium]